MGTQSLVFLLVKSFVYVHSCLLFKMDYGVSLLDWLARFGDGKNMWELGL